MVTRSTQPGAAEKGRTGDVVRLDEWRRQKKGAGEAALRQVSRQDCLKMLNQIAPLGQELVDLLNVPENIYLIDAGEGSQPSLSSAPNLGISGVAAHIQGGRDFPADVPAYGILVTSVGGNAFCTLLDKARKIIVCSNVRNIQAEEGSWASFTADLRDALKLARSKAAGGEKFNFALVNEGEQSAI